MAPFTYDWYQDQSGQDNHWTADNVTVNDVMLDSPTITFAYGILLTQARIAI